MTTIQEVVLQIKDKNVKWEDTVEEMYFKKKKACFSSLPTPTAQMLALTVVVSIMIFLLLKTVLVLLELRLIRFLAYLLFLN